MFSEPRQSESLKRAFKQLDNAAANLDNGFPQDWRGKAATLIGCIRLALQFPGQYEITHLAKELEEALKLLAKKS